MEQPNTKRNTFLICLALVLLTLVAFEPIRHNSFVHIDDATYVTENPHIAQGITWDSVKWAFTASYAANWHPLTWLSHMLDYHLFGLNPLGHHLVNLFIHIINTLLLFLVLKSMTRAIWLSAFVAAVFALHPLHVESVAWASERKDVLSTLFWMLTMAAYTRYARNPNIAKFALVVLIYAIGLTAKPMLVTLPFVLLLLDFWPLARVQFAPRKAKDSPTSPALDEAFAPASVSRLIIEKIPLFILVLASCMVTYLVQQHGGAVASVEGLTIMDRIANALVSYVDYISKMLWPSNLAVIYPLLIEDDAMSQAILSLFKLIAITAAVIYMSRQRGYLALGWLWYLGTLVPVIGLVQVGSQSMADRYTYIPSIGISIMIVWGASQILAKWRFGKITIRILACVILIAMVASTRKHTAYWKDSLSLFEHAVEVTDDNFLAHYNAGVAYNTLGRYHDAIAAFEKTIAIKPNNTTALYNLGVSYGKLGQHEKAIRFCKMAVRYKPQYAEAILMQGVAHFQLGRYPQAIDFCKQAIVVNPDYAKAYYNLGTTRSKLNEFAEAIVAFKEAVRLQPDYIEAILMQGIAHFKLAQHPQAIKTFQEAIRIDPDFAEAYDNLGFVYRKTDQYPQAIKAFQKAISINPDFAKAHYNLGTTYGKMHQYPDAIAALKEAVRINPDYAEAHDNMGFAYRATEQYPQAIKAFQEAIRISPDYTKAHYNLGVTYGNLGRYNEAIDLLKHTVRINPNHPSAYFFLAMAYNSLARPLDAIDAFKEAIRTKPDFVQAHLNLGITYGKLDRHPEAIATLKHVITINPDFPRAHYLLGLAYHTIDDKTSAMAQYNKLKKLDDQLAQKLLELIKK